MIHVMDRKSHLCVDVAAEEDEEADDVEVAGADGVVEGGDALVVGGRRVRHLQGLLIVFINHQLLIINYYLLPAAPSS